jgi:hypothetical protein
VPTFASDGCAADDGTWSDGWTIARNDGGFDLQWPVDVGAACALDGTAFVCEDAVDAERTLSLSGTFASASAGTASLTVVGADCSSDAEFQLRAAWTDGLVPPDGACPPNYGAYGPSERTEVVGFTVHNRTAASIGLYELSEADPIYAGDIAPGSSPATGILDGYYALADGFDEAACGLFFRLTVEGQQVVWDGGA